MLLCLLFRLFYLYQGTRMTWIKEETLFTLLYWLSPIFTCITITIQMCEGLYISLDSPSLIFYRDGHKRLALVCVTMHPGSFLATRRVHANWDLPFDYPLMQLVCKNTVIHGEGNG